jgi:hypothetical protein
MDVTAAEDIGLILGQAKSVLVNFGLYDVTVATFGAIMIVTAVRYFLSMWSK